MLTVAERTGSGWSWFAKFSVAPRSEPRRRYPIGLRRGDERVPPWKRLSFDRPRAELFWRDHLIWPASEPRLHLCPKAASLQLVHDALQTAKVCLLHLNDTA